MSTSNRARAPRARHLHIVPSSSVESPETTPDFSELEAQSPQRRRYDVFLSHRYVDREGVAALKRHIEADLGYSVYVDWLDSPELDRSKVTPETAEYLRRVMRKCDCLIFYAGSNAPESRWMPWELGFFDGRQGSRRIAVYHPAGVEPSSQQEYLGLYRTIDDDSLEAFIRQAGDDTAAMTSATYDQAVRHAERLASDPVDYMLSVMQWQYGVAANMLLDPERAVVTGDGQPDGPLREPASLYTHTYEALRAMQAQLAQMRELARKSNGEGAHNVAAWPGMLPSDWLKSPWNAWLNLWVKPRSDSFDGMFYT